MESFKKILHFAKEHILDFIFPRNCLLCGKLNPQGEYEYICGKCQDTVRLLDGARCLHCGEPIGPKDMPNVKACPACAEKRFAFDEARCVCSFDGVAREIVHELKYRTGAHVVRDMSKIAAKLPDLGDFIKDAVLVPIPLHNLRAIRRRYNQSELIAKMLTQTFPESHARVKCILKRTRATPTQTTLDRDARAANVKGAFCVSGGKNASIPKSTKIVLVDDVMTSGATLSECAKVLKKIGYKNVCAFTFAKRL